MDLTHCPELRRPHIATGWVNQSVLQLLAKPQSFIDNENIYLTRRLISVVCCRTSHNGNVTLRVKRLIVRGNVANATSKVHRDKDRAEGTHVDV